MTEKHTPIPTQAAKQIAETYNKSVVIICAYDPISGLLHTTTYGFNPQNKAWAAQGGEIATLALGASNLHFQYEDYRVQQASELLRALKSVLRIVKEASANYEDCHALTFALANPDKKAPYITGEIKQIYETVRKAEEYLG